MVLLLMHRTRMVLLLMYYYSLPSTLCIPHHHHGCHFTLYNFIITTVRWPCVGEGLLSPFFHPVAPKPTSSETCPMPPLFPSTSKSTTLFFSSSHPPAIQMDKASREDAEAAFRLFDRNGNGKITAVELGECLRALGLTPTKEVGLCCAC